MALYASMQTPEEPKNMKRRPITLRDAARLLPIPWAAWWIFFAVSSTLTARTITPLDIGATLAAIAVFGVSSLLVWRHELPGAILLAAEGAFVVIGYPVTSNQRFPLATVIVVVA